MELPLQRVEEFLHNRIPLSKALNCQILECRNSSISIRVPKFTNTVEGEQLFPGSAMAVSSLTAWTLLQVALRKLDYLPDIKLIKANWQASEDPDLESSGLAAHCNLPYDKEWQQFLRMLSRKAEATISLVTKTNGSSNGIGTFTCEFEVRDLDHR
ncbi:YiiD C-terminal domain-containing protein [Puniceicoccaceae bacterium K14]|nr:YiiD C-terminal domain-containing protein [Puniceicoccaceae bacterium K14]